MDSGVTLSSLPSWYTIPYLERALSLGNDVVSKLEAQAVDGRFLRDQYAQGCLRETLSAHPFRIPLAIAAKIEQWVGGSIGRADEYIVAPRTVVLLDDLIAQEHTWSSIGQRLSAIQFELDNELRIAKKPKSQEWFWRVTKADGGPKVQVKVLFAEAQQQLCLTELLRAVRNVLPGTGLNLARAQISNSTFAPKGVVEEMRNPFVDSMHIQAQNKTMLASTLLSQTQDTVLKKHVTRLMLALGENNAWLKFAKSKGATSSAAAEKRISDAQATGEPEAIVVPAIAQAPGYLALAFLADLKAINVAHVSEAVQRIEEHLVCLENATQTKGDHVAQVNSSIRQWIVENNLCDVSSQAEIQARVDALKDFEVVSLDDLKLMREDQFKECGFKGLKATKAFEAARKLK